MFSRDLSMGIHFKISVCLVANLEILSILKKINWPREKFRNCPTSGAGVRVMGRRRQRWHWARWLSHRTLFVFGFAIFAQAIKNETRNWSSGELKMKLLARLNTRTAPPTSLSEFFPRNYATPAENRRMQIFQLDRGFQNFRSQFPVALSAKESCSNVECDVC